MDVKQARRMVPDARIRELGGVTKGEDERIDEGVLRWFGHVERIENNKTAKRVHVGECAGSHSVARARKRWIDTVKDCLKKRGLEVTQARRMVQDRNEWGDCEGECMGCRSGYEPPS